MQDVWPKMGGIMKTAQEIREQISQLYMYKEKIYASIDNPDYRNTMNRIALLEWVLE